MVHSLQYILHLSLSPPLLHILLSLSLSSYLLPSEKGDIPRWLSHNYVLQGEEEEGGGEKEEEEECYLSEQALLAPAPAQAEQLGEPPYVEKYFHSFHLTTMSALRRIFTPSAPLPQRQEESAVVATQPMSLA